MSNSVHRLCPRYTSDQLDCLKANSYSERPRLKARHRDGGEIRRLVQVGIAVNTFGRFVLEGFALLRLAILTKSGGSRGKKLEGCLHCLKSVFLFFQMLLEDRTSASGSLGLRRLKL